MEKLLTHLTEITSNGTGRERMVLALERLQQFKKNFKSGFNNESK
jgi:hypothetical protein